MILICQSIPCTDLRDLRHTVVLLHADSIQGFALLHHMLYCICRDLYGSCCLGSHTGLSPLNRCLGSRASPRFFRGWVIRMVS